MKKYYECQKYFKLDGWTLTACRGCEDRFRTGRVWSGCNVWCYRLQCDVRYTKLPKEHAARMILTNEIKGG